MSLTEMLGGLHEFRQGTCLGWCPEHSKCSINVRCHWCALGIMDSEELSTGY